MHLLHLSFGIEFRFRFGFGSVKSLCFGFGSVSVKSRFGRSLEKYHRKSKLEKSEKERFFDGNIYTATAFYTGEF